MISPSPDGSASDEEIDRKLVLIVDDDQIFRTVARAYLEYEGFRVEEAENGGAAVARFEDLAPDVVLLDIRMPGLDGFDTCTALRGLRDGRRTPIVMMTGIDDRESIERAFEVGATDFVAKPINSFVLAKRIQYILRANRYLVHFDGLTGLPKRDLFLEQLEAAISGARRRGSFVAILFVALDNFERFNTTLGHRAGDQILGRVAERLGHLRISDFLALNDSSADREGTSQSAPADEAAPAVARFGGDEFMLLLPDIETESQIASVAMKVRERLAAPFDIDGDEIHVTASTGVAVYPLDGDEPSVLIEHAAAAMSHAKQCGRDRYQFYSESLNDRAVERLSVEKQLRRALDHDDLQLYFQPKIDIRSDRIAGFEALVRMPSFGADAVPVETLISVAEDSGLVAALGDWVFRRSCADFARLQPMIEGTSHVAINLSASQFRAENVHREIAEVVAAAGLEPESVELELTERALLDDTESSIESLEQFRELGFRIAIDDFGTGYSSLSYLSRFPVDVVKIDRAFIKDVPKNARDVTIVETIIDLCRRLSLQVVAEGVERPEQVRFLGERGCEFVQGFLYSEPVPMDVLADWIAEWDARSDSALMSVVRDSLRCGPQESTV